MQLMVQNNLQQIPKDWLKDFRKDMANTYVHLCQYYKRLNNPDLPSDTEMIEYLMEWCHRSASLEEFSDCTYYQVLDEYESDLFFNDSMIAHKAGFSHDFLIVARADHLSLFVENVNEYINMPAKEIW